MILSIVSFFSNMFTTVGQAANVVPLSTIGIVKIVVSSSLLTASIVVIAGHFFERNRLKIDRHSQLQKEIYFHLQKKAEAVFEGIHILKKRVDLFTVVINGVLNKKINAPIELSDDFEKERMRVPAFLTQYFPQVDTGQYDKAADMFTGMGNLYFKLYKEKILNQKDIEQFGQLSKCFDNNMFDLMEKLRRELEKLKEDIK